MLKSRVDWRFYSRSKRTCKLNKGKCYIPRGNFFSFLNETKKKICEQLTNLISHLFHFSVKSIKKMNVDFSIGKMLGGTSSMNYMVYLRGTKADFTEWADLGNPGWDYEGVLPYFKKCEGNQNEKLVAFHNGYYHNANGPVKITSPNISEFNAALMNALIKCGIDFIPDLNADKDAGFTMCQSTNANGVRSSTAISYLAPAKNRKNFHVIKHAYATKILLNEENEAYGVEFTYKGKHQMKALCKKEVIVSAGTLLSPPLLMRSGIGPKKHLKKRKIPCKVDLPVGKNFRDHLFVTLSFAFNVSKSAIPSTFGMDALYQYVTQNSGPFASLPIISGRVDPTNGTGTPEIQIIFLIAPRGDSESLAGIYTVLQLDQLIEKNNKILQLHDILVILISLNKPKSKGVIKLPKNCTREEPIMETNYLDDSRDRTLLLQAIKQQWNLMHTKYFQKIGAQYLPVSLSECDKMKPYSDDYWKCYMDYICDSGITFFLILLDV